MNVRERIELIDDITSRWLTSSGTSLVDAVEKTTNENLFARPDVIHSIQCLMKNVNADNMLDWAENLSSDPIDKKILCLHAGNLPLVGFQDALACLISGVDYYGKISRKDPFLLADFLEQFGGTELEERIHYSMDINDFAGLEADAVTFSGSDESVPVIRHIIREKNIARPDARYLIRTAHFSMAYLDTFNDENASGLAEAILRYDGRGCRSVAVVVTPVELNAISCTFTDYFESYWLKNPVHRKPSPKTVYRFAFNKAVGKPQIILEHLIIENNDPAFDNDDVISWVTGGPEKVVELAEKYGNRLQNIYITGPEIQIPGAKDKIDQLQKAQCPDLNWKPDGVDILKWINSLS